MVVKTDLCHFSEYKIYPGHGQKFVGKDAKITFFLNQKVERLFHQKIKAAKLTWTQAWRRMNRKGKVEVGGRRKGKKAMKFQKAIVGLSLDDMRKKKAVRTELRSAAKEQAVSEARKRVNNNGGKKGPSGASKKAEKAPKQPKNAGGAMKQKNFRK